MRLGGRPVRYRAAPTGSVMPKPTLIFVEDHDDVVFDKAPLELVLCQVRFSPVLALMDEAGVAGFQEAVRRHYPNFRGDREVEFSVNPGQASVRQKAPIWRMADEEQKWVVSVAVDFVALETPDYSDFREFRERLKFVLAAAERTIHPGRSSRVGLRKINVFSDPDVTAAPGWRGLLRPEILGLAGVEDLAGSLQRSYAEVELADDSHGKLTIRFGIDPEDKSRSRFRLDLDYWTETGFKVSPESTLLERVEGYSDAITNFFHWAITSDLHTRLKPRPRGTHA